MAWTHINLVLLALQRHPMNSNCCRAVTELYNIIIISYNSLHEHSLYDSLYNLLQSTCDFITKQLTRHESNLRSTSFWAYTNFFVRIFRMLCRSVYFFFWKRTNFRHVALSHSLFEVLHRRTSSYLVDVCMRIYLRIIIIIIKFVRRDTCIYVSIYSTKGAKIDNLCLMEKFQPVASACACLWNRNKHSAFLSSIAFLQ